MAARQKAVSSKSGAAKPRRKSGAPAAKGQSAGVAVADLRKERNLLRTQLQRAEGRVEELEELLEQALNQIDWAIDSLQTAISDDR